MFIQLWLTSICLCIAIQCAVLNTQNEKPISIFESSKRHTFDDDIDYLGDKKFNTENNDSMSNPDEYADEEDDGDTDDDVLKTTISTTMAPPILTTIKLRIVQKSSEQKKTKVNNIKNTDFESNEFSDDYEDDVEYDTSNNEITMKSTITWSSSTKPIPVTHRQTSMRAFLNFLSRPLIAASVLGGLAIGIIISVVLLICIIRHFQERERSHSFTAGLLYPNQYGYSRTPQEFYA